MTSEEKDVIAHKMVIHQFFFTKKLAKALKEGKGVWKSKCLYLKKQLKVLRTLKIWSINLIITFFSCSK